jgi:hypothetical protein
MPGGECCRHGGDEAVRCSEAHNDKIPEVHPAIRQAHHIHHRQPCIAVDSLGHQVAPLGQDFTEEGVELGLHIDNEPASPQCFVRIAEATELVVARQDVGVEVI